MPVSQNAAPVGLGLSIGIAAIAIGFVAWLWVERKNRSRLELSDKDLSHFSRQDRRRGLVALILVLLAAGISVGSRLEPKVNGHANRFFVGLWLVIFVLVFMLLLLAMFDWLATRSYAIRHIRSLAKERAEILKDEVRIRSRPDPGLNGWNGTARPQHDSSE